MLRGYGGGRFSKRSWVLGDLQARRKGSSLCSPCGNDEDLKWVAKVLAAKFVIKVRAVLGPEDEDQKDEVLLGRFVRWRSCGI